MFYALSLEYTQCYVIHDVEYSYFTPTVKAFMPKEKNEIIYLYNTHVYSFNVLMHDKVCMYIIWNHTLVLSNTITFDLK